MRAGNVGDLDAGWGQQSFSRREWTAGSTDCSLEEGVYKTIGPFCRFIQDLTAACTAVDECWVYCGRDEIEMGECYYE